MASPLPGAAGPARPPSRPFGEYDSPPPPGPDASGKSFFPITPIPYAPTPNLDGSPYRRAANPRPHEIADQKAKLDAAKPILKPILEKILAESDAASEQLKRSLIGIPTTEAEAEQDRTELLTRFLQGKSGEAAIAAIDRNILIDCVLELLPILSGQAKLRGKDIYAAWTNFKNFRKLLKEINLDLGLLNQCHDKDAFKTYFLEAAKQLEYSRLPGKSSPRKFFTEALEYSYKNDLLSAWTILALRENQTADITLFSQMLNEKFSTEAPLQTLREALFREASRSCTEYFAAPLAEITRLIDSAKKDFKSSPFPLVSCLLEMFDRNEIGEVINRLAATGVITQLVEDFLRSKQATEPNGHHAKACVLVESFKKFRDLMKGTLFILINPLELRNALLTEDAEERENKLQDLLALVEINLPRGLFLHDGDRELFIRARAAAKEANYLTLWTSLALRYSLMTDPANGNEERNQKKQGLQRALHAQLQYPSIRGIVGAVIDERHALKMDQMDDAAILKIEPLGKVLLERKPQESDEGEAVQTYSETALQAFIKECCTVDNADPQADHNSDLAAKDLYFLDQAVEWHNLRDLTIRSLESLAHEEGDPVKKARIQGILVEIANREASEKIGEKFAEILDEEEPTSDAFLESFTTPADARLNPNDLKLKEFFGINSRYISGESLRVLIVLELQKIASDPTLTQEKRDIITTKFLTPIVNRESTLLSKATAYYSMAKWLFPEEADNEACLRVAQGAVTLRNPSLRTLVYANFPNISRKQKIKIFFCNFFFFWIFKHFISNFVANIVNCIREKIPSPATANLPKKLLRILAQSINECLTDAHNQVGRNERRILEETVNALDSFRFEVTLFDGTINWGETCLKQIMWPKLKPEKSVAKLGKALLCIVSSPFLIVGAVMCYACCIAAWPIDTLINATSQKIVKGQLRRGIPKIQQVLFEALQTNVAKLNITAFLCDRIRNKLLSEEEQAPKEAEPKAEKKAEPQEEPAPKEGKAKPKEADLNTTIELVLTQLVGRMCQYLKDPLEAISPEQFLADPNGSWLQRKIEEHMLKGEKAAKKKGGEEEKKEPSIGQVAVQNTAKQLADVARNVVRTIYQYSLDVRTNLAFIESYLYLVTNLLNKSFKATTLVAEDEVTNKVAELEDLATAIAAYRTWDQTNAEVDKAPIGVPLMPDEKTRPLAKPMARKIAFQPVAPFVVEFLIGLNKTIKDETLVRQLLYNITDNLLNDPPGIE